MDHPITRRNLLRLGGAGAVFAVVSPLLSFAQTKPTEKKLLFFTRSQDFPHSVVTRKGNELAFAEKLLRDLAIANGYDITVTKDGTMLNPDQIGQYDAFIFYTTGDLTQPPGTKYKSDQTPAMTVDGKKALLDAVANGKGFLGLHCASDTFHSKKRDYLIRPDPAPDTIDPYIAMLGGEFMAHGAQQSALIHAVDPNFISGLTDFTLTEEWYSLYNFAPDLHAILIQDTSTMLVNGQQQWQYQRSPYPNTWARNHGSGRVFYTSMGHRDDVWTSDRYHRIILGPLAWITRGVDKDLPPNLKNVCPQMSIEATTRM